MYTHSELIFVYNPHLIPIESHLYNPHTFAVGETLIDRSSMFLLFFVHIHCQCHFKLQESKKALLPEPPSMAPPPPPVSAVPPPFAPQGLEMRT